MTPPRRKKWTEVEERTLIDKYKEMVSNGTLGKMKTREKKFKPIACYVNSLHNVVDPVVFPWQWTWKDVSTKVQNMRHQYLLVKQKIKKLSDSSGEEFDWLEGLTHWSNFLRYKEVFGDVPLGSNGNEMAGSGGENGGMENVEFGRDMGDGDFGVGMDGGEGDDGILGLGFEYDSREVEENYGNENGDGMRKDGDGGFSYEEDVNESRVRKKRKFERGMEKKVLGFFTHQLDELKKMETRYAQREAEREEERRRRDIVLMELVQARGRRWEEREKHRKERQKAEDELTRLRKEQWESFEKESALKERRREEELNNVNEWEEMMNKRRSEWMKQMDEMLGQHRAEMKQVQARILHEQQNFTSQLLGMVGQWAGHTTFPSDPTGQHSHYISHMMHNMHQESGIIRDDTVDDGDNQDDQFVVD